MRPGTVTVRIISVNTTELAGPGILDEVKALGVPFMRSRVGKAWQIPGRHTDDLCAALEARGHRVVVTL